MAVATEDTTESAGVANPSSSSEDNGDSQPKNEISVRELFSISGAERIVYDIDVGSGAKTHGWKIRDGSKVIIAGSGLNFFTKLGFEVGGTLYSIPDFSYGGGRRVEFTVPEVFKNKLSEGTGMTLVFIRDSLHDANTRYLNEEFYYTTKEQSAQSQEGGGGGGDNRHGKGGGASGGAGGTGGAGAGGIGGQQEKSHLIEGLVSDTIGGLVESKGKKEGTQPSAEAGMNGSKPSAKNVADESFLDYDDESEIQTDEVQEAAPAVILPENLKQAAELVGEHIDKNPELIADSAIRSEVLSALGSGNLASLSTEGRSALQRTITSQASVQGGGSAQLQEAMKIVGSQTTSVSAQAVSSSQGTQTAQVTTTTEAETTGGGGTAEAQAQTEVQTTINAGASGATGGGGSVAGTVGGGAQAAPATGAGGGMSAKQSAEVVGEYLDKNPGLVTDVKVRNEVLSALGGGNVDGLSAEGKQVIKTLAQSSGGHPAKVQQAASQLSQPSGGASASAAPAASTGSASIAGGGSSGAGGAAKVEQPGTTNVSASGSAGGGGQTSPSAQSEAVPAPGGDTTSAPAAPGGSGTGVSAAAPAASGGVSEAAPSAAPVSAAAPAPEPGGGAAVAPSQPQPASVSPTAGAAAPESIAPATSSPSESAKQETTAGTGPVDGVQPPPEIQAMLSNLGHGAGTASRGLPVGQPPLNKGLQKFPAQVASPLPKGKFDGVVGKAMDLAKAVRPEPKGLDNQKKPRLGDFANPPKGPPEGSVDLSQEGGEVEEVTKDVEILSKFTTLAEEIARLAGRSDVANILQDLQGTLDPEALKNADPGAVKNMAGNMAGKYAGKGAQALGKKFGKNIGGGAAAGLGGAVAGAVEGEGGLDIAKNALSWYIVYIASGALWTLVGSIPALIYLDFHYFMSKLKIKWFTTLTLPQKMNLAAANIVIIFAAILLTIMFFFIGCNYPFPGKLSALSVLGYSDLCETINSKITGGSSTASLTPSVAGTATVRPPAEIVQVAQNYSLDACTLNTAVKKLPPGNVTAADIDWVAKTLSSELNSNGGNLEQAFQSVLGSSQAAADAMTIYKYECSSP